MAINLQRHIITKPLFNNKSINNMVYGINQLILFVLICQWYLNYNLLIVLIKIVNIILIPVTFVRTKRLDNCIEKIISEKKIDSYLKKKMVKGHININYNILVQQDIWRNLKLT